MPRAVAVLIASRTRSSASIRPATYRVLTGTSARSASTTELRPATTSLEARPLRVPPDRRTPPPDRVSAPLAADLAILCALCCGRSAALGVGPLPSSPRRRWPPEPTVEPFLELPLRTAPRRWELPAIVPC